MRIECYRALSLTAEQFVLNLKCVLEVRGEGYDDMPEYIKVEMRLGLCVDQIFTQVLGV